MHKVRPGDSLHRFFVASGGTDEEMAGLEYMVDLEMHKGAGQCGCKWWSCQIWPKLRDGSHPDGFWDPEFSCAHLTAARKFQYSEFMTILLNEKQKTNPTRLTYVKKSEGAVVHSDAREEARQQARIEAPPIDDSAPF